MPTDTPTGTPTGTTAGVLRPDLLARHASLRRTPPTAALAPWVEHHWTLAWDLPEVVRVPSQVLGHPTANLSLERGHPRAGLEPDQTVLTGVPTRRFDVDLAGAGWVWGVRFRPGGLTALTGLPAGPLVDRSVPAAGRLPGDVVAALDAVPTGAGDPTEEEPTRAAVEAALAPLTTGEPDPSYDEVLAVVATMLGDRDLVRVDQVARRCGTSPRRLQRLFAHHLGVGPKWVLARYRIHDVVTALDEGYDGPLADLAAAHGWYDQAHFARDFGLTVGCAPSDYRADGRAAT